MAYEPTTWNCGDTITAEKLNKLENGLAECCGGGTEPLILMVFASGFYNPELDRYMTVTDFQEAYAQGRVVLAAEDEGRPLSWVQIDSDGRALVQTMWYSSYNNALSITDWSLTDAGIYSYVSYKSPAFTQEL